ncbi:Glycerol-3-phosphate dehydrogenase [NAD(P)+] [Roseovarius albus]|uniref:Glycerol-3-phosphate dehydrogenase [NAD(P)+] n=1 Tax=Roseovarius albus TaxID=1247867 RepID=A0A1X6ZVK8_9RHOB|nr:NAD(P)H-dependent glycerol-3-phosphate dehydrogenase [Roseovarius albus]SLN62951.1 Glycerol-3-phosphate dehydrogenase [NAD(P)+] [Roseovarius albus]
MICVMGAGAFGTALAISLAHNGEVSLWARDARHAQEMDQHRENRKRLPGIMLPDRISIHSDPSSLPEDSTILLSIPTQKLRAALTEHAKTLSRATLVACCKGIELSTGKGPVQIINEILPNAKTAILTGPSFADDIARDLPTALTLACEDEAVGKTLQNNLTTPNLRLYRTTDVTGAELGGALKNVIAIGCGTVIGAGLGESARAALMTRGFAEMSRMAVSLGANVETLAGLSGFGDLVLTCGSDQSRNFRYGRSIGRDETFDSAVTVEGAATAKAVRDIAHEKSLEMPITEVIAALIDQELRVDQAMDMLLSRPLKEE